MAIDGPQCHYTFDKRRGRVRRGKPTREGELLFYEVLLDLDHDPIAQDLFLRIRMNKKGKFKPTQAWLAEAYQHYHGSNFVYLNHLVNCRRAAEGLPLLRWFINKAHKKDLKLHFFVRARSKLLRPLPLHLNAPSHVDPISLAKQRVHFLLLLLLLLVLKWWAVRSVVSGTHTKLLTVMMIGIALGLESAVVIEFNPKSKSNLPSKCRKMRQHLHNIVTHSFPHCYSRESLGSVPDLQEGRSAIFNEIFYLYLDLFLRASITLFF